MTCRKSDTISVTGTLYKQVVGLVLFGTQPSSHVKFRSNTKGWHERYIHGKAQPRHDDLESLSHTVSTRYTVTSSSNYLHAQHAAIAHQNLTEVKVKPIERKSVSCVMRSHRRSIYCCTQRVLTWVAHNSNSTHQAALAPTKLPLHVSCMLCMLCIDTVSSRRLLL